jgi:predicted nucleic acid-binding protein
MIIIDTNVISESMRPRPNQGVIAWFNAQPWDSLYLCTPVLAELRYGAERLPRSRRKDVLSAAIDRIEKELYEGRVLSFDQASAANYAHVVTLCERQGRRIQQMDVLIAAIALTHHASIATRDIAGFADLGLELVDPFEPH